MGRRVEMTNWQFALGDRVEKVSGASWRGRVVGAYISSLTEEGYCVESENEPGSVQIYPLQALRLVEEAPKALEERLPPPPAGVDPGKWTLVPPRNVVPGEPEPEPSRLDCVVFENLPVDRWLTVDELIDEGFHKLHGFKVGTVQPALSRLAGIGWLKQARVKGQYGRFYLRWSEDEADEPGS